MTLRTAIGVLFIEVYVLIIRGVLIRGVSLYNDSIQLQRFIQDFLVVVGKKFVGHCHSVVYHVPTVPART